MLVSVRSAIPDESERRTDHDQIFGVLQDVRSAADAGEEADKLHAHGQRDVSRQFVSRLGSDVGPDHRFRSVEVSAVFVLQNRFDLGTRSLTVVVGSSVRKRRSQVLEVLKARDTIQERLDSLTPREYEVMLQLITGALNKVVAHQLRIAVKTVKVHRAHVMDKMGVRSVAELLHLCHLAGIDPDVDLES